MLIPEDIKIYLYNTPTDMRKSIDTLCIMVSEILKMNPLDGHLFLFRNLPIANEDAKFAALN